MKKFVRIVTLSLTIAASWNVPSALACSRFWINNYLCSGEVIGCTLIGTMEGGGCIYACPTC
jgi:hypothetical protein